MTADSIKRRLRSAAATDQPFETALTLPGFVYHDTELFQRELSGLFGDWVCVGHVAALDEAGSSRVVDIGADSIIITCDREAGLNAFHNVCRHRGTRLLNVNEAPCRHIVCPYHAWRYGNDGQLKNAPGMDGRPGFSAADHALQPVRVETLLGFIFVCLNDGRPALDKFFPDLPDLSAFGLERLQRGAMHDYNVAGNWKLICENYNECYHCPGAHPQLHRLSNDADLPEFDHRGKNFTGGPMRINAPFASMTRDGQSGRPLLPGFDGQRADLVFYFNLFPNLLLSIAPDYAMAHYILPRAPDATYVQTEWLFAAQAMAEPDFDPSDAVEFWDQTNRQDWALCENAQRGLASSGHRSGPYHPLERCVHDFDRWYLRTISA